MKQTDGLAVDGSYNIVIGKVACGLRTDSLSGELHATATNDQSWSQFWSQLMMMIVQ